MLKEIELLDNPTAIIRGITKMLGYAPTIKEAYDFLKPTIDKLYSQIVEPNLDKLYKMIRTKFNYNPPT